jgi:hypothetical protein
VPSGLGGRAPMIDFLGRLPTTNARIAVTILLIFGTGVVTLWRWTEPPVAWLSFLVLSAGLDVAQFHSKRTTAWAPGGQKASESEET